MLNIQVLNAIEKKIKSDEQRFVIRAVIQNRFVRDELNSFNEQVISNSFPENQLNLWNPATISFLGKGINPEWLENLKNNFIRTVDEELISRAFKTYERILVEKELQPNLEDAFLVSLVLHDNFIRSGSWKDISRKIPSHLDKLNSSEKEFWSAVFGCLINTIPNSSEPLIQLLKENPYQNSVEIIANSLLMTPLSDNDLIELLTEILSTLKVETIIRFLLILNYSGATQIAQDVARIINNKIPSVNNVRDIIDKANDHFDWINAQELALVIQQIGLLKSFAGDTQKAGAFFDESNQILLNQINGLNKLNSDIQIQSWDKTNNVNTQIDVQSPSTIFNKLNPENQKILHANEQNGWPIYKIDWNPIKDLELLISEDRFQEASDSLEKIKENRKNDPDYYRLCSEINYALGDINTAFENCLIAFSLKPNDIKIQKLLAILYYQKGLWEKSFNLYKNINMQGAEFSTEEISHLVQAAIKAKQPDYALEVCNSYVIIKGENSLINFFRAQIELSKSNIADAYKFLQKSIELDKYNAEAWICLSILENINKNQEKSLEALLTGYKYIPDSLEICIALAEKFLEMGNNLNGFSKLKEACSKSVTNLNTTINLVNLLEKYRLFPELENTIQEAGKKWKKNIDITKSKANYFLEMERFDDAKKVLNPYLIAKKIDIEGLILYLLSLWGSNYSNFPEKSNVSKKNFKEIQIVLEQLRLLDEKDIWYKMMLAEYNRVQGEKQKAFEIYQHLVEDKHNLSPDILWRIQSGLSQLLIEIGQTDTAITFLLEVIDYNPALPQPYFRLFDAYKKNGLLINAFEIANKCLKVHSSKNIVRKWYVEEIKTIDKSKEAIEYLSDLTKKTQSNSEFLLVTALLEFETNHHDIANQMILELSQRKDLSSNCLVDLAHLYILIGDIDNALKCLKIATNNSNNDDINIYLGLAYLYRLINNYNDSIKSLIKLLEYDKKNINYLLFLAENQIKKNDSEGLHATLSQIQSELSNQDWGTDIIQNSIVFDKSWVPNSWSKIIASNENVYAFLAFLYYHFGEYKNALEMAEKGLVNNCELNPLRVFTAELAHAMLNDEMAEHVINGIDSIEVKDKNNKNLIELICQKAEIALSRGEEILAASLISDYFPSNENNLRLKCLQSRLFLRQGDYNSAKLFFDDVLNHSSKSQEKEEDGKSDNQISEFPNEYPIWLFEAAIELENYECISKLIIKSSELKQLTPMVLLLNLKAVSNLIVTNDYLLETKAKCRIQDLEVICKDKWPIIEEYTRKEEDTLPELSNWINIFTQIKNPKEEIINIEINKNTIPFIAYLYRKTGKFDDLIGLLDHFSDSSEVHAQISFAFQTSDYEKAIAHIQTSTVLAPNKPIYYAFYAILLFRHGVVDQGLELIERALSLSPDEFEWLLIAADGCEKTNKLGKALFYLEKAFELDSSNVSIARWLGRGYYENGDRVMAAKIIQKFVQPGSESFKELVILAESNLAEKKYRAACDYAQRAIRLNPQSSEPYVILGKIALDLKNIDNVCINVKRAIELDPKNIRAFILYSGVIELKQGVEAALRFLESNRDFSPDSPEIIIEKTKLISRLEGTEKAYDFIQKYSSLMNSQILTVLVKIEILLGKNNEAEKHARESVDIHPNQPDLLSILGKLNEDKGNLDQAIKYYSNAITLEPIQIDNYLKLCDIYLKQRNSSDALKVITHGIEIIPENAKLHAKMGMIYWEMKEYKNAENALEKATYLNPKDDEIIRQLNETKVQNMLHQKYEVEINK